MIGFSEKGEARADKKINVVVVLRDRRFAANSLPQSANGKRLEKEPGEARRKTAWLAFKTTPASTGCARGGHSSGNPASLNESDYDHNHCDEQQEVNQAAHRVRGYRAQQPQHEKN